MHNEYDKVIFIILKLQSLYINFEKLIQREFSYDEFS